jgi:uncharacterized ferritin-like protein (DUF455 family)
VPPDENHLLALASIIFAAILCGRMELREFAESVLFAGSLQAKLAAPPDLTDDQPGLPIPTPTHPGRPPELRFKPQHSGKSNVPRIQIPEKPGERGRLLHFFANHELLATELMALVLLRFPDAPKAFRQAVLRTLKDEQEHTRWYLARMRQCGVDFGELPLSGYFWRAISAMESPLDYVAGLSLTFEQANLDFARYYSRAFARIGDQSSAELLQRIYRDEITHVACGLKWFKKWKNPDENDWQAFQRCLKFPLSPQRAKGPEFNIEGRLAAGLDPLFIDQLKAFAQSKGRTPVVFVFNPFAEAYVARGDSFTPGRLQQTLQQDLANLPQFLCRRDDVVLVEHRPSPAFLNNLEAAGFPVPEFALMAHGKVDLNGALGKRKLNGLRPWAWGPDSVKLLSPLFANLTSPRLNPNSYFNPQLGNLYSKEWSAEFLRLILEELGDEVVQSHSQKDPASWKDWLCSSHEAGRGASDLSQALGHIEEIRNSGHHRVVVKEALGVAGRNAIRLLEPQLQDNQRRWMQRILEQGHRLVIEPWLNRVADFSVQLEMEPAGLRPIEYTGLLNDWKGEYQGNWACPGFGRGNCLDFSKLFPKVPDIRRQLTHLYSRIIRRLELKLREAGYLGPIGIDAFVYTDDKGEARLKPIVEINPRYTMGRVTVELMRYVAPGSTGVFRVVNQQHVLASGFANFPTWAGSMREQRPIHLEGKPVPKIRSGFICLTEPERAQSCVATFEVTESWNPPQTEAGRKDSAARSGS